MSIKTDKAAQNHQKGYNCAQAVACAFAEETGIPEEILFAACEGFGLGMGGMAATCGAVSGAVMLAGLKNSCKNLEQPASKEDTYKLTREITKTFLEKNMKMKNLKKQHKTFINFLSKQNPFYLIITQLCFLLFMIQF